MELVAEEVLDGRAVVAMDLMVLTRRTSSWACKGSVSSVLSPVICISLGVPARLRQCNGKVCGHRPLRLTSCTHNFQQIQNDEHVSVVHIQVFCSPTAPIGMQGDSFCSTTWTHHQSYSLFNKLEGAGDDEQIWTQTFPGVDEGRHFRDSDKRLVLPSLRRSAPAAGVRRAHESRAVRVLVSMSSD